jgi:hypothetical protein
MGTRSYICIVWRGVVYIWYRHFDGYPEGAGRDLLLDLKEMTSSMTWEEIEAALDAITWVQWEPHVNMSAYFRNGELLKAIRAKTILIEGRLDCLANLHPLEMQRDLEYCYVVNFDQRTLMGMSLSCVIPFWGAIPMTPDIDIDRELAVADKFVASIH